MSITDLVLPCPAIPLTKSKSNLAIKQSSLPEQRVSVKYGANRRVSNEGEKVAPTATPQAATTVAVDPVNVSY